MLFKKSSFKYKQVILVRTDLKMGKGKLAVQVAHAAVTAALDAQKTKPDWFRNWIGEGQKKVAVKVSSEKELREYYQAALDLGFPASIIQDAGYTQLEPGTTTAVGIGPCPEEKLDELTKELKLL